MLDLAIEAVGLERLEPGAELRVLVGRQAGDGFLDVVDAHNANIIWDFSHSNESFRRSQIVFRLRPYIVSKPLLSNVSREQGRCFNDLPKLTSPHSATAFDIRPHIRLMPNHLAHRRAHSG